jgi:hypothetical protein
VTFLLAIFNPTQENCSLQNHISKELSYLKHKIQLKLIGSLDYLYKLEATEIVSASSTVMQGFYGSDGCPLLVPESETLHVF